MEETTQEKRTLMTAHQALAIKGTMVYEIFRLSQSILDKLKLNDEPMKEVQDTAMKDPSPKRDDIVDMFYNIGDDLERHAEKTVKVLSEVSGLIG